MLKMGTRKKTITQTCAACDFMKVNENNEMTCKWGKGKPKILHPQKGKKPLTCKLVDK
jgi:hypothetical protein